MEKNKTEQLLELLLAKMDKMMASQERKMAKWDSHLGKGEACEEKTEACMDKKEPTPEETEPVAEPQEIPEGATDEETIGAMEDRSRDLRLAVGCRGQLKTRIKCDGGSWQECAATVRRPTRCTVPAMCKGHVHKGPGKKCRRSGIRGRAKAVRNGKKGMIGKRHLERRKALYAAVEPTLGPEVVRIVVRTSVGLWKMSIWLLWKCRPPPKRKR
jgi:hypothetical protein